MKRIFICAMALLTLLLPAVAEESRPGDSIPWETTIAQAQAQLGANATVQREEWGDCGSVTVVTSENARCLDMDCARLVLVFFNDDLCSVTGWLTGDDPEGALQALTDAMVTRFGEPEPPVEGGMSLGDLAGAGARRVCSWRSDEDTFIDITDFSALYAADPQSNPYTCCFEAVNTWVYDDMSDAAETYADTMD